MGPAMFIPSLQRSGDSFTSEDTIVGDTKPIDIVING
jgi:hypothetical protein